MGINTRIGKVSDATYSAPATTAAAVTLTYTTNTPTATTAYTIADGSSPTVVESGEVFQGVVTMLNKLITDMVAMKAALAQVGVDNAAMLAQLNDSE